MPPPLRPIDSTAIWVPPFSPTDFSKPSAETGRRFSRSLFHSSSFGISLLFVQQIAHSRQLGANFGLLSSSR
jgi:hypothetical protein